MKNPIGMIFVDNADLMDTQYKDPSFGQVFYAKVDGEIKDVSTLQNQGHDQGGCMVPVNLLAEHNVKALIVGGIGMRPLMGFKDVGINVYHEGERLEIKPVVEDLILGALPEMRQDQVCGGSAGPPPGECKGSAA